MTNQPFSRLSQTHLARQCNFIGRTTLACFYGCFLSNKRNETWTGQKDFKRATSWYQYHTPTPRNVSVMVNFTLRNDRNCARYYTISCELNDHRNRNFCHRKFLLVSCYSQRSGLLNVTKHIRQLRVFTTFLGVEVHIYHAQQ